LRTGTATFIGSAPSRDVVEGLVAADAERRADVAWRRVSTSRTSWPRFGDAGRGQLTAVVVLPVPPFG